MPSDSLGEYFACKLRGRAVAAVVSQHGAPPPPEPIWVTHIWVDDPDQTGELVEQAGGSVIGPPFDSPAGGRMALVSDPAGAVFCVWHPGERKGAELVNDPGAWAMSQLHSTDTEAAQSFYGAVFGWQTETLAMGETEIMLLRLPGFVGGEPQQPVPRDLVAVMVPASGDSVSHWAVDFWVDDADAFAARATELGGDVNIAPHDIPGFRNAVLADPQGAAFSVSKLLMAR